MTEQMSETPILDLLATMTAASIDVSGLDEQSLMLVRLAALVAVDAPPASYLLNLGAASEMGIDEGRVRDVLAAVAPIVRHDAHRFGYRQYRACARDRDRACGSRKRVTVERCLRGQRYSCCLSQRVATDPQIGGR